MAKNKQYKFDLSDGTIEDGYTILVISGGLATVATEAEAQLAERNGGRPVVAKVVERKAAKKKERN